MDQDRIDELESVIGRDYGNIVGLVALKNGVTRYERYFQGFSPSDAVHVFSVTKSVVSVLLGIAVDQGFIRSVDQKVLEFFPDYQVKRGEKTLQQISLQNLLTMTAPYKYKSAPYTKYFSSDSWVKASLDLLGGKGTVGTFRYAPLIGPDIVTGILQKATGRSALQFARENLFTPLGIAVTTNVTFQTKEEQLDIMKNRNAPGWVADLQGNNAAGWGLFLTPKDMSKIGQLMLNHGQWNGRPVVSGAWIDKSTAVHSRWQAFGYGYLWWVMDASEHSFAALGDGGNAIYVNPAKQTVVAVASRFKPRVRDRIELIKTWIEPMLERCDDL